MDSIGFKTFRPKRWRFTLIHVCACLLLLGVSSKLAHLEGQREVRPKFFTYDELIQLSEQEPLPDALQERLQALRTTPFVSNDASARGVRPVKPNSSKLGKSLRVASWNIERGLKFDAIRAAFLGPKQLERLLDKTIYPKGSPKRALILKQAAWLKDADVVVLNEVDWGMKRTGYRNVAGELASALGMNYAWGVEFVEVDPMLLGTEKFEEAPPAERAAMIERIKVEPARYLGLHGNAILSRYPLTNVRLIPFQLQGHDWYAQEKAGRSYLQKSRERTGEEVFLEKTTRQIRRGGRMMLLADIVDAEIPGGRATIVSTHLESETKPESRRKQLEEVLAAIRDITNPMIIAGDMNTSTTDTTPTSLKRELKNKFGDEDYWIKTGVKYATGLGLLESFGEVVTGFSRKYADPTVRNVRFVSENDEAKFFETLKDFRFTDGGAFDFRGESNRSANGRTSTLANSNERASKGFVPTLEFARTVGPVGKYKLDWIFVKPFALTDPEGKDQPHLFAPHFGRTLGELNNSIAGRISDHNPIIVNLPLTDKSVPNL